MNDSLRYINAVAVQYELLKRMEFLLSSDYADGGVTGMEHVVVAQTYAGYYLLDLNAENQTPFEWILEMPSTELDDLLSDITDGMHSERTGNIAGLDRIVIALSKFLNIHVADVARAQLVAELLQLDEFNYTDIYHAVLQCNTVEH